MRSPTALQLGTACLEAMAASEEHLRDPQLALVFRAAAETLRLLYGQTVGWQHTDPAVLLCRAVSDRCASVGSRDPWS
jgi:hypothetical protein